MRYELYTSPSEYESNVLPATATFDTMLTKIEEVMSQGGKIKAFINGKRIVETRRLNLTFDEVKAILTQANSQEHGTAPGSDKPYRCATCGGALHFIETWFVDGLTYCVVHTPSFSRESEGW